MSCSLKDKKVLLLLTLFTRKPRPVNVDVKLSAYKDFGIKNNDKDSVGSKTC